jgi:segregation and condensation protein B
MSKRTRKKKTDETVDAVVRDILAPDEAAAPAPGDAAAGEPVGELSDALDALDGGPQGAHVGDANDGGRQTWAERVDPAGLTSEEEAEFEEEEAEFEDDESEVEDDESDVVIFDADAEDRAEEYARQSAEAAPADDGAPDGEVAPGGQPRELAELVAACEALIFVSDEPLSAKALADILKEDRGWVQVAVEELAKEYGERTGGLMLREVAGGWQLATRPEHHESIRAFLKSKPSAKLSLAALETLAVIAYKQPITVPEILEIRGVQSSSAIKTLLDKRLIIAKGRKETVGRPMMYGTSKEFLMQFGLRDLGELPSIEDFEDLAAGEA